MASSSELDARELERLTIQNLFLIIQLEARQVNRIYLITNTTVKIRQTTRIAIQLVKALSTLEKKPFI